MHMRKNRYWLLPTYIYLYLNYSSISDTHDIFCRNASTSICIKFFLEFTFRWYEITNHSVIYLFLFYKKCGDYKFYPTANFTSSCVLIIILSAQIIISTIITMYHLFTGIILILVNLVAFLMVLFYGYALFQNIFKKGAIFFQQLGSRKQIELKFDENIHRLDSIRTSKVLY